MSKIKVNSIEAATGTTVTLPSGQTLDLSSGTVTLPNSSVNLTTKVTGTLPVANGGTGLTTLGSATQVLRVNSGATALEFAAVSSDYVLLATTNASNVASVSFDGYFSATYQNYIILLSDYYHATSGSGMYMNFRRSNADVTAANYATIALNYQTGGADSQISTGQNQFNIFLGGSANNSATSASARTITIFNPLSTTSHKPMTYTGWSVRSDGNIFVTCGSGQLSDNANALSGVSFSSSSGNIYGNFKLYGLK